jgi:hypothetical protein
MINIFIFFILQEEIEFYGSIRAVAALPGSISQHVPHDEIIVFNLGEVCCLVGYR